jgi:hypothetical protein
MDVVFTPATVRADRPADRPFREYIVRRMDAPGAMRLGMIQFSPEARGWRARVFVPATVDGPGVVTLKGAHYRTALDAAFAIALHHDPDNRPGVTYAIPAPPAPSPAPKAPEGGEAA